MEESQTLPDLAVHEADQGQLDAYELPLIPEQVHASRNQPHGRRRDGELQLRLFRGDDQCWDVEVSMTCASRMLRQSEYSEDLRQSNCGNLFRCLSKSYAYGVKLFDGVVTQLEGGHIT